MEEAVPATPAEPAAPAAQPALARRAARLSRFVTPATGSALIALGYLVFACFSLTSYGLTSDSPALFYSGDRTLFAILHPKQPGVLDLLAPNDPPGFVKRYERFPDFKDPVHYPVIPGLAAAASAKLFHETLHWAPSDLDGHHLGLVLLNTVALFLFGLYACWTLGLGGGLAAAVLLALFPAGVGHSFNNAKDWPCAQFYGLAVLAGGLGVVRDRFRHLLAAGVLLGVAMGAKMNAAFVLPTMVLWAPFAYFVLYFRRQALSARLVGGFLLAPYVGFLVFFLTWPWLYYGRAPDWWAHLNEYVSFMANYGAGQRPTWTDYPLLCVAFMTPPIVLFLALAAFAQPLWRDREKLATLGLFVVWFGLPILRIAAPKSNFYDANRHFIEYVPALCAIAGMGAANVAGWVRRLLVRLDRASLAPAGIGAAAVAGLACAVVPVAEYHPFETTYFNALVGGLGGAQQRGLFAARPPSDIRANGTEGDFWFGSVRVAARDVNKLPDRGDKVGICGASRYMAQVNWPDPKPRLVEVQEEPDFSNSNYIYISPRETACWWWFIRKLERERELVYRVERGGGLVYEILGKKKAVPGEPYSKHSAYEDDPLPTDRLGVERYPIHLRLEHGGKPPAPPKR